MVDYDIFTANRAYLIMTRTLHGPDILDSEHAYAKYTLLAATIAEYHNTY